MLAVVVKDVVYCGHGHHMVPRDEMTQMLSDDGKSWRRVCKACKEATLKSRQKVKRAHGQ